MADFRQTFILFMFIGLVIGNPTSRFPPDYRLTGSCTFESSLCGFTPLSGQSASWFQITTTDNNHGIPPSTDGHYAYFKTNNIDINTGDNGSLVSPKLNIDGCIDLEFLYILPYRKTMTLSIKLQEAGQTTLVKDITGMNMNKWVNTKINNICLTKNTQLIFETTKLSYYGYVGIDNIKVTMSQLVKPSTTTTSPTTKEPTQSLTTKPKAEPTMTTTKQPTTTGLHSTTSTTDVEKLWYMKDIERLELEKQKLHLEINSEMEKSELEKQKLHLEIKLLKEQLGQK